MSVNNDYQTMLKAFKFMNEALFDNQLPEPFISFRANKNTWGYFSPYRVSTKENQRTTHEIALNLAGSEREPKIVLATFVHEMCHEWDEEFGKPGKGKYHSKSWADQMEKVGLQPYNISNPEKRTGNNCTHKIIDGGPFDKAADALLETGWTITVYEKQTEPSLARARRKAQQRKQKYECPSCKIKVWGKPGLRMICGDCSYPDEPDGLVWLLEV